jgi:hypothetical protein
MPTNFELREYLVEFDEGIDQTAALEGLASSGGRIVHRLAPRRVVIAVDLPDEKVRELMPAGARLVASDSAGDRAPSDQTLVKPIVEQAFRLRRSLSFREAKVRRPHEGQDWGEGDLQAPDVSDDEQGPAAGTQMAREASARVPTNERLINDTAVGIVIVKGSGSTAISEAEKVNIVAEVQEGLSMLSGFDTTAKASWSYIVKEATVENRPWEGAQWPGMPATFYKGIDAAFIREDNGKIYMFRGDQYVRFSNVKAGVDAGYPKPIAGNWPGLPAEFTSGIDAVLWRLSNGKIYMFKGSQYVRFSNVEAGVDAGYPKPIAGNWPGLPAEFASGIDAVLLRKDNGKIYMFKGDQYVRFSDVEGGVDAGYPKLISEGWPGLPEDFKEGINAALWRNSNEKIYFFKTDRMVGRYVRFSDVAAGVDPGYEQGMPIGLGMEEAEALWRDPALTALGYSKGMDGVKQLVADLQKNSNTQWAYCAFFTKHPTVWFAYAGSSRVVMRWDDFSAGKTGNMDRVFAHETGHIFGAPDEYASSNCGCNALKGKFFRKPNDNCANCNPDPSVSCIMRSNSPSVCSNTPWHLGWGAFMTKIDAAVWRMDSDKLYLFSNDKYIRFTEVSAGRDEGYPKDIAGNWPGLPNSFKNGIDAALWREDNGKLYFFKGNRYVRFSKVSDGVDAGYPKLIAGNWGGLPEGFNNGIDAALWRKDNGKIYMFKGNQYVRFSDVDAGMDAGYPKPIAGNWAGLPASFQNGIDAALLRRDNGKIYFFKGTRYVRFTNVDDGIDPGYPKWINTNWMPFPK